MDTLKEWLAAVGLERYSDVFAEQEIEFEHLSLLTDEDVRELGLPIGPRRKLLHAISGLRGGHPTMSEAIVGQSDAERRQLTVMFVDLADSTPMALRLDPEVMSDVLRAFQNTVVEEIGRLGFVAKLMGDGVLAYFGWPRAHEDDARRATTTALAIVDAVANLSSPTDEPLACRVGIATGLVVVGDLIGKAAAQEHVVVGATPNLAARLQEVAESGEVMIADATRRLLGAGFVIEDKGERRLKGHEQPTPLFRVLRQETHGSRFADRGETDDLPLIGREAELALLLRAWDEARSGRGQAALVTGEAGIGKSRLLQSFVETIDADAATLSVFQCSPLHSDNPFWPVLSGNPSAAQVVTFDADATEHDDSDQRQRETIDALAAHTLLGDQPILLVIEDLQWADTATMELVHRLTETVSAEPAFLIMTGRPEAGPAFDAAVNLKRLVLTRLDRASAAALIAETAADNLPAPRLRNDILARSDGIPLFLEEMTKAVIETNPDGGAVAVPGTLRDSLIARLDVSPAMKSVAQIASCIGRDFDEALLRDASDIEITELQEGLSALREAGLIMTGARGNYRFKHALLCDIAYETLLTPRRQRLHRALAESLEERFDDLGKREPESLARHLYGAGENKRAEAYWLRAQQRAALWHKQLDALADYLQSDTCKTLSHVNRPDYRKLH